MMPRGRTGVFVLIFICAFVVIAFLSRPAPPPQPTATPAPTPQALQPDPNVLLAEKWNDQKEVLISHIEFDIGAGNYQRAIDEAQKYLPLDDSGRIAELLDRATSLAPKPPAQPTAVTSFILDKAFNRTSRPGKAKDQLRVILKNQPFTTDQLRAFAMEAIADHATSSCLVQFFTDGSAIVDWNGTGSLREKDLKHYVGLVTVETDEQGKLYTNKATLAE